MKSFSPFPVKLGNCHAVRSIHTPPSLPYLRGGAKGFTLVELLISMGVFAIMSMTVLSVYIQVTNISHQLTATRYLTETAREITDRIASDVREKGIAESSLHVFDPSTTHPGYQGQNYTGSGGEVLTIRDGRRYVYGRKTLTGILPCEMTDRADTSVFCGLYLLQAGDTTGLSSLSVVDSFIPDESRKRVKISDLHFWISGDVMTEKKVTLVMTLTLMPRIGVPPSMIEKTRMQIQTTLSERGYQGY